jgi:hypothetical protein
MTRCGPFLAALWLVEETPTLSALEKAATDAGAFTLNRRDQEELWRFLAALLVSAEDLRRSGALQTKNLRSVRSWLPPCRPRRTIVTSRLSAPRGDAGQRPSEKWCKSFEFCNSAGPGVRLKRRRGQSALANLAR